MLPDAVVHKSCGCAIVTYRLHNTERQDISRCPLHQAASDMLAALEAVLAEWSKGTPDDMVTPMLMARDAIAAAKGS